MVRSFLCSFNYLFSYFRCFSLFSTSSFLSFSFFFTVRCFCIESKISLSFSGSINASLVVVHLWRFRNRFRGRHAKDSVVFLWSEEGGKSSSSNVWWRGKDFDVTWTFSQENGVLHFNRDRISSDQGKDEKKNEWWKEKSFRLKKKCEAKDHFSVEKCSGWYSLLLSLFFLLLSLFCLMQEEVQISQPRSMVHKTHVDLNFNWQGIEDPARMFHFEKKLGSGAYGQVHKAIHVDTVRRFLSPNRRGEGKLDGEICWLMIIVRFILTFPGFSVSGENRSDVESEREATCRRHGGD